MECNLGWIKESKHDESPSTRTSFLLTLFPRHPAPPLHPTPPFLLSLLPYPIRSTTMSSEEELAHVPDMSLARQYFLVTSGPTDQRAMAKDALFKGIEENSTSKWRA